MSTHFHYYTIPSDNRELQHFCALYLFIVYYTIPSDNRELQPALLTTPQTLNYTIPSDNRELQQEDTRVEDTQDYTIPSDNRELQRSNHKAPANENYTIPSDNEENQKSILKLRKNRNQLSHYNKKRKPCKSRLPVLNRRARDGTRTRGPDLGKVVLHQLSHSRICKLFCICLPDTFDIILWEK